MFLRLSVLFIMVFSAASVFAATELNPEMKRLMGTYLTDAQASDASIKAFSAEAGKELFFMERMHTKKNKKRGCTTCHTKDPAKEGKTPVGKVIDPVSPAVNAERFTTPKHVEKWFRRNCKWVLERECTPEEKGNYITFMISL